MVMLRVHAATDLISLVYYKKNWLNHNQPELKRLSEALNKASPGGVFPPYNLKLEALAKEFIKTEIQQPYGEHYIAIHWRQEWVASQNLQSCSRLLMNRVRALISKHPNMKFGSIFLAIDVDRSATSARSPNETKWFLDNLFTQAPLPIVRYSSFTNMAISVIVDKIICREAHLFIGSFNNKGTTMARNAPGCYLPSSVSKEILEHRKVLNKLNTTYLGAW
jgi:hypothetical protein